MPDQPGKVPQSSTPLSVEDVDRIAENFTPFWEDAGDATERVGSAAAIRVPEPAPSHAGLAKTAASKPTLQPTVQGIAPIFIGAAPSPAGTASRAAPDPLNVTLPMQARQTPGPHEPVPSAGPAPSLAAPQPLSTVTPLPAVRASSPQSLAVHKQTLLGHLPAAATPSAIDGDLPSVPDRPSPPGYAIAYKPKDGPGTPAVVIAAEALLDAPSAGTLQAGVAQASQLAETAVTERAAATGTDDFDLYLRKKKANRIVWAVGAAAALLLIGLLAIRALTSVEPASGRGVAVTSAIPAAAPPPRPPPLPTANPEPVALPNEADLPLTEVAPDNRRPGVPMPSAAALPAVAATKATARRGPVRAVTRSPAPAPRERAAASLPVEPGVPAPAAPKANSSKGVIVRESPF